MTLTCKIGKFVFEENTPLSKAKLIRDTVMGHYLKPDPMRKPIRSEEDCMEFALQLFKTDGSRLITIVLQ